VLSAKINESIPSAAIFLKWQHNDLNAQNIRFKTCVTLAAVNYLDS
jgi:hypothetical protein